MKGNERKGRMKEGNDLSIYIKIKDIPQTTKRNIFNYQESVWCS